jgi:ribosomal protein S18 acetylase RimI-like enzyme
VSEPDRLVVRLALASELGRAGDLTERAYRVDGFLESDEGYATSLRDTAARSSEAELWVAVEGQTVLGTVTYCPIGSPLRELAVRDDQAEFRMLAVDPAARGRGVGQALAEFCVARARRSGAREVVISSLSAMHAAHRLYASLGFQRAPDLDWSPDPGVLLHGYRLALNGVEPPSAGLV